MTKNIIAGMEAHGMKRIVYTASAGIHQELTGVSGKLMMTMLKNALVDHGAAVEQIRSHGLNYTITRPMGLTNSEFTGRYRETAEGVPKKSMSIPRADVAHFIVKALDDPRYENRSIGLAT